MSAAVVPFSFEGLGVRIVVRDGAPWFVLADLCRVIEIGNPSDAARRLEGDERHTLDIVEGAKINGLTPGASMPTLVNESGLYRLILTSRKPAAKRFTKWVTSEVLPTIRRTGGYDVRDHVAALSDPTTLRTLLLDFTSKVATLEAEKAAMEPKAQAFHTMADATGSMCITDVAKLLTVPPKDLFAWLRQHGWIYRRDGTSWIGYQDKLTSGLVEHKYAPVVRRDGSERLYAQVRITAKGLAVIGAKMHELAA